LSILVIPLSNKNCKSEPVNTSETDIFFTTVYSGAEWVSTIQVPGIVLFADYSRNNHDYSSILLACEDETLNFQRLEHNTVIYLYIRMVLEGASCGLRLKLKSVIKNSFYK
jgi:hypothetical protein